MIFLPKFKYSFNYIRSIRTSHSFRATPKIGNIEFREIFAIQILFPSFFFLFALKFWRDISPRSFSDDDRRPHLCRNKRIVRAGNVECIVYLYITFGKDCCHILHRIYSSRIIIFGKNCVRQTFGPCLNLEASRCRWCECVKNCVLRLTYSLSYRSCTIHRNAVCVCVGVWVCVCVGVSVSRKKNFPISDAHFGERSCANPLGSIIFPQNFACPVDGIIGGRVEGLCTRAITNDQAYTDDEQKHWFDKNDYRWLRERGVCTRPALGIYIETNPISHYVLDLSLPVNSQFMLVISRCIYILLNPRKKRPVTQKLL